ncbi:helix-turn-helix transcriptional regulator [Streptomyces sp. NPDC059454]|uniref:helix-turn-helix transcriptional regulator n=1 Tax=Streptomyces sp. NPDC059454 TaxID=3346836 RepID=UPI00369E2683
MPRTKWPPVRHSGRAAPRRWGESGGAAGTGGPVHAPVPPERADSSGGRVDQEARAGGITHNLSDPDLSPAAIAAHHHISVRLLHALFEQETETVGATIRRRRLERTRTDLADPRLRHRTIGEIALRWGFRHPADFSRTFRRAYGIPPSDFRHTA